MPKTEIVEKVEFSEGSEPDDEYEGEPAEFTVTFTETFAERTYEQLLDGYMCFTRDQLIEFCNKAREALGGI